MFFEDLSSYTYLLPEQEQPGTLNVGWLDSKHPIPTGPTSTMFLAKLQRLCLRRVKQTRGFHPCEFWKGRDQPRGSAEIRVAHNGRIYAAPELIHHYVEAHSYKPPDEFIEAVLAWDESRR